MFARKIIRLCGYSTTDDIENEAKAVGILCSRRESKYVVEVLQHGWLANANIYYFIDMEYCPETLEDRLTTWRQQSDRLTTPQAFLSLTAIQAGIRTDHIQEQTADNSHRHQQTPNPNPLQTLRNAEVRSAVDTEQDHALDIDWHPILTIFLDVTKGLRYIHSKGFVHRDLKPKNGITFINNELLMSSPIFP